MNKSNLYFSSIAIACALCVAAVPALAQGQAASKSEQQSLATIKKEINAAYAQQKSECNRGAKSERASCLQQASQTYRSDMGNARQLVANAPSGGVSERVVSTSTSPATDGGATAVGSSQAASTASGSADAANPAADAKQGMDAGAAATGNSGSGSTASGSSEAGATAAGTDAASGEMKSIEPQPQPPAVTTPPRSEDTPIQR